MKSKTKIRGTAIVLLFVCASAFAATVSFVKKTSAGTPGNFEYTYNYTCNDGTKGTLTVTSGNDNEALQLAELEAQEKCGEN